MFWFIFTGIFILIGVGGILVGAAATTGEGKFGGFALGVGSFLAWIGITVAFFMGHTVENGHIGIVKTFGSITGTTGEGLVWTAPWQNLSEVTVRNELRTYEMEDPSQSAISKDSQDVFLKVQVNYSLQRDGAVDLYRETGGHYVDRILDPGVFQITKEITAQYKAIEFAANREKIRQQIEEHLQKEVGTVVDTNGNTLEALRINNVSLKNVRFTKALSTAIEQTVEAEQQAKRERAKIDIAEAQAKQKVAAAEGEAKSNVTRAAGDAKANRLRQQSLTDRLIQWEAIQKLNPNVSIIVCPPRTVCIPNSGVTPVETGR
jgi:regulator of protease activity HflC (stomatin/prohibitin superfamily)